LYSNRTTKIIKSIALFHLLYHVALKEM